MAGLGTYELKRLRYLVKGGAGWNLVITHKTTSCKTPRAREHFISWVGVCFPPSPKLEHANGGSWARLLGGQPGIILLFLLWLPLWQDRKILAGVKGRCSRRLGVVKKQNWQHEAFIIHRPYLVSVKMGKLATARWQQTRGSAFCVGESVCTGLIRRS